MPKIKCVLFKKYPAATFPLPATGPFWPAVAAVRLRRRSVPSPPPSSPSSVLAPAQRKGARQYEFGGVTKSSLRRRLHPTPCPTITQLMVPNTGSSPLKVHPRSTPPRRQRPEHRRRRRRRHLSPLKAIQIRRFCRSSRQLEVLDGVPTAVEYPCLALVPASISLDHGHVGLRR